MEEKELELVQDTGTETETARAEDTKQNTKEKRTVMMRFSAFLERNWSWGLAVILTLIFMIIVMIIMQVAPFGDNSFSTIDSMHQYIPFFSDYQRKTRGFESIFYTWNVGMGQNYLSLLLYYMASPLNLIMIFFSRYGIFAAFSLLVALKICISAGTFGYWLSRRKGNESNSLLITGFSLAFALSNYMVGYYWNVMWLDCIMVLPLAVLGLERIFQGKSPRLYILSMFYILFVNYYIAFMICIFLVLWFFAHRQGSIKGFFLNGLKFAGCSLLAAGMAAFSLLAAYVGIMQTAAAGTPLPKQEWYGNFFEQLNQHFAMLIPIDMNSNDSKLNAYCGVFAVVLFFLFLFCDRISLFERVRKLILLAVFIVSFNSKLLNFIWHGFHDQYGIPNRFSFLYIFVILTVGYEAVQRLRQMEKYRILLAGVFAAAFFTICSVKTDVVGVVPEVWMMVIALSLVVIYTALFFLRGMGKMRLATSGLVICIVMILEIYTNAALGFWKTDVASGEYYGRYEAVMAEAKENVDHYASLNEETFYREDVVLPRMLDEATYDGMRSVGTFCSTVTGDLVTAMGGLGCYTGANEFLYYGGNPVMNTMMDIRFTYVKRGEYAGISTRESAVYNGKGISVYETPYVLPLGYAVSDELMDWKGFELNRANSLNSFVNKACGVGSVYKGVTPKLTAEGTDCEAWVTDTRPKVINFERNEGASTIEVAASFTVETPGIYMLDTRQNYVETVRFYRNEKLQVSDRLQAQLYELGKLEEGDRIRLEFCFEFDQNSSDSGTISLYLSLLDQDAYKEMYEKLSSTALNITRVKDGSVDGTINMKKDGLMFTSIPYDKGWTVKVDGKEVKTEKVAGAFLGIRLEEGQHEIRMRYVSPGFIPGLLISIVSWGIFVLLMVLIRRKKRQKSNGFPLHEEE